MIGSVAYVGDEDDYRFYYYLNYIVNTRCLKSHTIRNLYIFFSGKLKLSNCQLHDVKKIEILIVIDVWLLFEQRDHETKSEPIDHFSMS